MRPKIKALTLCLFYTYLHSLFGATLTHHFSTQPMYNLTKYIPLILLLTVSPFLSAKQELRVGVGNFEPFFIEEGESGLFLDITKAIFSLLPEYDVKFIFMSNTRLLKDIDTSSRIDAACNIFAGSNTISYLSEPIFRYTDVAVTRKENAFVIKQVSDLKSRSIAAYQGATDLLGEEYKKMASINPQYSEYAHPDETTRLMATGKKDVRIGDIHIFLNDIKALVYKKRLQMDADDFEIHRLWPDVYTHIAFKDKGIRDKANEAIREIKRNGTLESIYTKYEAYLKVKIHTTSSIR